MRRVLIMGAAGRDFHNFNVVYREDPSVEVVAFTATQIPYIDDRTYPAALAGPRYPAGIPIHEEDALEDLIRDLRVDEVVFAYSDVSHEHVMHCASIANALGARFELNAAAAAEAALTTRSGAMSIPSDEKRAARVSRWADEKFVTIRYGMPRASRRASSEF